MVCFAFTANRETNNYFDINMNTMFHHYIAATSETTQYDIEGTTKDFTEYALLEVPVTSTEIVSNDELKLTVATGDALTVFRRNDGHESMTINGPKGVIVID
jgi:hypothetical protein